MSSARKYEPDVDIVSGRSDAWMGVRDSTSESVSMVDAGVPGGSRSPASVDIHVREQHKANARKDRREHTANCLQPRVLPVLERIGRVGAVVKWKLSIACKGMIGLGAG
jgi:hypothetical protein